MAVHLPGSGSPRGAAWAWCLAAVTWALIWLHGTQTHGFGTANETDLWLGATWMDSSKLLCVPFALVAVGLFLLGRGARVGRVTRWLWLLLLVVPAIQAIAVLVGNAPFPWGSYEVTFEELEEPGRVPALVAMTGPIQAVGAVVSTLLLARVGVALVRAGRLRWWAVPAAMGGMLFTFFTTPASWIPAVGFGLVAAGAAVMRLPRATRGAGAQTPEPL